MFKLHNFGLQKSENQETLLCFYVNPHGLPNISLTYRLLKFMTNLFSLCIDTFGICSYICYCSLPLKSPVFNIILLLFSLKKCSPLSAQNIGRFVLLLLFTCSQCIVIFYHLLIVGHLVLLLLFLLVLGVQWFLSLVVHFFLFLFWFPAISVAFWHCSLLAPRFFFPFFFFFVTTTIALIYFVPHIKLVYLSLYAVLCQIWTLFPSYERDTREIARVYMRVEYLVNHVGWHRNIKNIETPEFLSTEGNCKIIIVSEWCVG